MKRKTVLSALGAYLALAGCVSHPSGLARPVVVPPLPLSLAAPVHRLESVTDPSLRGLTTALVDTSSAYNNLAARYEALARLYQCAVLTVAGDRQTDCAVK